MPWRHLADADLVCVHVEATDEASHEGRVDAKIEALEQIDRHIVAPLAKALAGYGEHRILITPDHPTPLRTKTHSHGACPLPSPARASRRAGKPTTKSPRLGRPGVRRRLEIDGLLSGARAMSLIVQKFGGTSVADSQKILAAARKAIRARQEGNDVLVVVSAMGKNTDLLIDLAREITDEPPAREMDMLLSTGEQVSVALMAMAIHSLGHQAISLTGAQIGIKTDSTHTKARIQSISTERIARALAEGKIVIAAGFQGIDEDYNITTLGRGGSDTTAVALAAVLDADACEIYTDVDGVYTTDPRLLPEARRMRQISYDEMLELASLGAGVMHNRSIEFAKKFSVPIHVRSSFSDVPGTIIVARARIARPAGGRRRAGQERSPGNDRRRARSAGREPGDFFQDGGPSDHGRHDRAERRCRRHRRHFVYGRARRTASRRCRRRKRRPTNCDARGVSHDDDVAKVSVVGRGMATANRRRPANVPRPGRCRHEHPDDQHQRDQDFGPGRRAARRPAPCEPCIRRSSLDREPAAAARRAGTADRTAGAAAEIAMAIVARLQRMEDLTIDEITLDEQQGRLTISGVADKPGHRRRDFRRRGRRRHLCRHDRAKLWRWQQSQPELHRAANAVRGRQGGC